MFQKGQYILYGSTGVCLVTDITQDSPGHEVSDKWYYVLTPVRTKGSRIYTPVDNERIVLRPILTREEASQLMEQIPHINSIPISSEKLREETYREAMKSCDCTTWVRILKTLYARKCERRALGKKVTSVDERYWHAAEEQLCGELSVALDMSREELLELLTEKVTRMESPLI